MPFRILYCFYMKPGTYPNDISIILDLGAFNPEFCSDYIHFPVKILFSQL